MIILQIFYSLFKFYFLLFFVVILPKSSSQNELESVFTEGRHQYEEISRKVSTFGGCWKSAISELHMGCNRLTDEIQSRLALSFANCFLLNSGSQICNCPDDKIVAECLDNVDERIFSTYREFYTHTRSICYFLKHQVWQENTENTIKKLSSSSEKMKQQLSKSTKAQATILQMQQIALGKQQQLINNSETSLLNLNVELEKSRTSAKAVLNEFKSTTDEQRLLIFAVFDHIKKLETLVMGEFAGMFTFVYYFLTIILSYILTSAHQVARARLWLFALLTVNGILERIITVISIPEETTQQVLLYSDGPLYYRVWLCRKVFCIISFTVLAIAFFSYRDYNMINNRLLLELQRQHSEIQTFIKSIRESPKSSSLSTESTVHDESPKANTNNSVILSSGCPIDNVDKGAPPPPPNEHKSFITTLFDRLLVSKSKKKHECVDPSVSIPEKAEITPKKRRVRRASNNPIFNGSFGGVNETPQDGLDVLLSVVSPSTRYNLRRRTMTPPQSLSVSIKRAMKTSKENNQEIQAMMDSKK